MNTPGPHAVATSREVLRALASALQVYALYPAEHPNREQATGAILEQVRDLNRHTSDTPVVFCARESLYLGPTLLARESLSLFRLVDAFGDAGVEAVEFLPEVTADDLDALVRVLMDEQPRRERFGGVVINRVRPAQDTSEVESEGMIDLRRAYSMGLEMIRQTAIRVATGEPVDLDAATRTVERLADQVTQDPANALLLTTVKSYDEHTYYHMVNVCLLSVTIGQALGLRHDQVVSLGLGGLLHDVGKVNMPEDILFHVGRLSEEQWRIVQRHPVDGAGLVFATSDGLHHPAATVVLEHHAAYDLGGYPNLSHRTVPSLPARLVAVADCFDAVTSKRAYRAPASRREALEILESSAGQGFDPRVVRVFVSMMGLFPVGTLVQLDSGDVCLVVDNDDEELDRPTVLRLIDPAGNVAEREHWDLTTTDSSGQYRWNVVRTFDPNEYGIDVMEAVTTGTLEPGEALPAGGLVHEPSFGERRPDGYVDTHNEPGGHGHAHGVGGHTHGLDSHLDPDVHPPFEDDPRD